MSTRAKTFFITGTDTDVGKTRIACALLSKARALGYSTAAVKPLAAGAELVHGEWRNADAVALSEQCSIGLAYQEINPVCLQQPIAPHLAAIRESRCITLWELKNACLEVIQRGADVTLIEGAGGWLVPVNDRELLAELPRVLDVPVILVVGLRLGCLNHALLTARAIEQAGITLAGWVANHVDPHMAVAESNMLTLKQMIRAPLLASVPWMEAPDPGAVSAHFDDGVVHKFLGVKG